MALRNLLQDLTPPAIWRACDKLKRLVHRRKRFQYGVEQPPEFYDATFDRADHWKQHYCDSHYYPLWTVIADRLVKADVRSVLDIGCGPGQVACLLCDAGIDRYLGLDFSMARIAHARDACPSCQFIQADIFQSDLLETFEYDCVLTMEFLEHVERDLDVLRRVRAETRVLATVPNFPAAGHVRHFETAEAVKQRYSTVLTDLSVTDLLLDRSGRRHFILEGRR
jgi:2-polyprenyl-3-methyl-5-hydroxy-6-metoxy-1,4-benzoquinol methylase